MRIAYFTTSGPLALEPFRALLAAGWEVVLVVRPAGSSRLRTLAGRAARRLGLLAPDPVADLARSRAIPECRARRRDDPAMERALARVRPDLLCVSTFRWVLPPSVLELAPRGGLNLHSSLLPRHRGPLPLFWTYHGDDREAGVSVHRLEPRADAGDLLLQEGGPLARGYPVESLDADNARRGAPLLSQAVAELAKGSPRWATQSEADATAAPLLRPGTPMVDFATWRAERVWHFLAGLLPRYREPLRDRSGRPLQYVAVSGHERASAPPPPEARGRVERLGSRGALRCLDGWVHMELAP